MYRHNNHKSTVSKKNQNTTGVTTDILDKTAPQTAIYFADSQSAFGGFHKLTPARLGRSEWLPCGGKKLWDSPRTSVHTAHQYSS